MTRRSTGGVTLVELMIVVVILGVLSALATFGYRRYVGRARASEAVAMLAEMVSKQQLYYTEFARYAPITNRNPAVAPLASGAVAPSPEPPGEFFPRNPSTNFDSVRTSAPIPPNTWPPSWALLAVRPKDQNLYCTYYSNAGLAGSAPGGAFGHLLFRVAANGFVPAPWFYVLGSCNLEGDGGWPSGVTTFGLGSGSPTLVNFNDGK